MDPRNVDGIDEPWLVTAKNVILTIVIVGVMCSFVALEVGILVANVMMYDNGQASVGFMFEIFAWLLLLLPPYACIQIVKRLLQYYTNGWFSQYRQVQDYDRMESLEEILTPRVEVIPLNV